MALVLGKCVSAAKKGVIRLLIPQLKFDDFLNKHFRENEKILAHDPENICKEGDWVLTRKLNEQYRLDVEYRVEKVVYESGNIIDPVTNKKSLGYENIDDVQRIAEFFDQKLNK